MVESASKLQYLRLAEQLSRLELVYRHNPQAFLYEQAMTMDEASGSARPWWREPIIGEIIHALMTERLLLFPKSRRRYVTWTVSGFFVWDARFHGPHFNVIQSLSEEKASFVVGQRCQYIEDNLRQGFLRRGYRSWSSSSGDTKKLVYDHTGSTIIGVKEGGDAVRTYTITRLFMDESEFQPHSHDALKAAKPLMEPDKLVQIILASSSDGPSGPIASYCRDVGFTRFS